MLGAVDLQRSSDKTTMPPHVIIESLLEKYPLDQGPNNFVEPLAPNNVVKVFFINDLFLLEYCFYLLNSFLFIRSIAIPMLSASKLIKLTQYSTIASSISVRRLICV